MFIKFDQYQQEPLYLSSESWFKSVYELRTDHHVFAKFDFRFSLSEKTHIQSTSFQLRRIRKKWYSVNSTFVNSGGEELANVSFNNWNSSVKIVFNTGKEYIIKAENLWKKIHAVSDLSGNKLMTIKTNFFSKKTMEIQAESSLVKDADGFLLLLISLHAIIEKRRNTTHTYGG